MRIPDAVLHDKARGEIERMSLAFYKGLVPMKKSMSFLMDRCYVSDLVYNEAFGRHTTKAEMEQLRIIAKELRPVIVYVRTHHAVILERLRARGDRHIKTEADADAVWAAYEHWFGINPLDDRIVQVDGTLDLSNGESIMSVIKAIEGAE